MPLEFSTKNATQKSHDILLNLTMCSEHSLVKLYRMIICIVIAIVNVMFKLNSIATFQLCAIHSFSKVPQVGWLVGPCNFLPIAHTIP